MINIDIEPAGIISAYVEDKPFDLALAELQADGYKPISLEENARLRINQTKNAYVSIHGNWTREGFIYVPGEDKVRLVKNSPILASPAEATQAHREGKEFYLDSVPKEDSILVLYNQKAIPTDRFANEDITDFLFGAKAQAYGQFLRKGELGIKPMPISLVDKTYVNQQPKPFVRQCWFNKLGKDSRLNGNWRSLKYDLRLRGVRYVDSYVQKILFYKMEEQKDRIDTQIAEMNAMYKQLLEFLKEN